MSEAKGFGVMSGRLPPGVTDADIDNAAPQNEPDDEDEYLINLERDRHAFTCIFDRLREDFDDIHWLRNELAEMTEALK
jgi:hypothetical protein